MRPASPHHSDVFSHLPALLMRELRTEVVDGLLERLVVAGWRPGQLRHRVGAEPSQGNVERDAAHLVELLASLTGLPCPDAVHAEQVRARRLDRAVAAASAPLPASPEVRDQRLTEIRAELTGLPRRRPEPEARARPDCNLCGGEGSFFVTHEVHLCRRCVAALASGEARLSQAG